MPSDPATAAVKPFLQALSGRVSSPPPIWLMRQAGRYLPEYRAVRAEVGGFLDLCYDPERAAEVTLQPLRRYGFDAAILFSDILVVPDALGQRVRFQEGEGPSLSPLRTTEEIEALDPSRLGDHLAPVYATLDRLKTALPPATALIGFAGAPWTVATYMVEGRGSKEFIETKKMAFDRPALFGRLIEILTEATGDYLITQIDHGAEAIQLFDSWAGVLSEEQFERWVIQPNRALVDRIRKERPGIPVIGFPRGAGLLTEAFVDGTGVDAVSLDTTVPLDWAARVLQPKVTLQGNLDPVCLIVGGEVLDREIDRILDILGKGPFIFNLGHGIQPSTPPQNVSRLIDRIRRRSSF